MQAYFFVGFDDDDSYYTRLNYTDMDIFYNM